MESPKRFLSIKNRLLILFVLLMLMPLLVVGIMSYRYYYAAVWDSTTLAAGQTAGNLAKDIERVFFEAEKFLEIGSYTVAEHYLAGRGDSYGNAKEILALINYYRGRHRTNLDIRNIYLVGINNIGISEREGVFRLQTGFDSVPSLKQLQYGSYDAAIITFNPYDLSGYWEKPAWQLAAFTDYRPALGLGRYVWDSIRKEILGVAIVEVDSDSINKICKGINAISNIKFTVFDARGKYLFGETEQGTREEWAGVLDSSRSGESGQFIRSLGGEETFFVYNSSVRTGWKIIGRESMDVMMSKAYRIRNITIASVVGCILFTMLLYAFISARITKPINILQNNMQAAAKGNLDVRFLSGRRDEISSLGESFNTMIGRIKELMEQTRLEQENLKKAEFRALQAQINPHFLYNTLDAIIWMSQASKHEELMDMVVALSKFFRLTLGSGKEVVTVGEEVDHAKNYLIIQHMRYHDIMSYEFSVDPALRRFRMIKLTLQPLIENAIYHGLKNKRGGGKIRIEGYHDQEAGNVVFIVADNGRGMSEGRLREVIADMNDVSPGKSDDGGHALRNVHERIQLSYGDSFGLTVESGEDVGTSVMMIFPAVEPNYV